MQKTSYFVKDQEVVKESGMGELQAKNKGSFQKTFVIFGLEVYSE